MFDLVISICAPSAAYFIGYADNILTVRMEMVINLFCHLATNSVHSFEISNTCIADTAG